MFEVIDWFLDRWTRSNVVTAPGWRSIPTSTPSSPVGSPDERRARGDSGSTAHLRRRLHSYRTWTILLRSCHLEDFHVGVLLHRRPLRYLRYWHPPHQPPAAAARKQAIFLRSRRGRIKPEEIPNQRKCCGRIDGPLRRCLCLPFRLDNAVRLLTTSLG